MSYPVAMWLHIVSATLMVGVGLGSAFYFWAAVRTGESQIMAHVARWVVRADWWFTAPTVVLQPITGVLLIHITGRAPDSTWLLISYALYAVAGLCWLPVVRLQIQMRDLAKAGVAPFEPNFQRLYRRWFWLGCIAFSAIAVLYWLMVAKPY